MSSEVDHRALDDPVRSADPVHERLGTDEEVAAATRGQAILTQAILAEAGLASLDDLVRPAPGASAGPDGSDGSPAVSAAAPANGLPAEEMVAS